MKTGWPSLLVVVGLLILLTYLLVQSRPPDPMRRARLHAALHEFKLHDAELNRDVLLTRTGLLPHYDSLDQSLDTMLRALDTLDVWQTEAPVVIRTAMAKPVADLRTAVLDKETRLEYFKSDNALLQNSLMYFAHTSYALSTQPQHGRLTTMVGALSNAMLRFVRTPQRQVREEIETLLNGLPTGSLLQQDLELLDVHGRLILEVLPKVDHLLRQLLLAPTTAEARQLQDAALQHLSGLEARAQFFRVMLYAVAILLLAYLVYLLIRLRANAHTLEQTNADLHREMAERTQLEHKTRQQELQLIQANKMTALGTVVAGVAHEINNPNQLVLMNARVLDDTWADAARVLDAYYEENGDFLIGGLPYGEMRQTIPDLIHDTHDGARRIDRIVNHLKDFARPRGHVGQETFDLNDAVERAVGLLQHVIQMRTTCFQVELGEDLPHLQGDLQHVEQMVVNLVVNALEALPAPECGVAITTQYCEAENSLQLDVKDEGIGVPPEHLDRLCDPFFTTKQEQGGTGLGLAITYTLVRDHGGRLTFESAPGEGTCARVMLPCAS
ncbi:MAG: hypothetical protein ETSY1_34110 [Candidatus Entotheonella factor]|uniref:histidine kinase n=1 Tax=Entotheonella factor TaxID=1429438 RepID=W4LBB1_ENTF1|nr:MAG: hypothetical protein ETSY1_34110 [Candidatus Entotheonella factor]